MAEEGGSLGSSDPHLNPVGVYLATARERGRGRKRGKKGGKKGKKEKNLLVVPKWKCLVGFLRGLANSDSEVPEGRFLWLYLSAGCSVQANGTMHVSCLKTKQERYLKSYCFIKLIS